MIKLGLIGFPLGHSFSKSYYLNKFEREDITGIDYELYALESIDSFKKLYDTDVEFRGFNVTIPHKMAVMPLLNELSPEAEAIGAVNCITIDHKGGQPILKGYNTDAFGFEESLKPLLKNCHKKALVLGNGGAAKAVLYALTKLGIPYLIVSRTKDNGDLTYEELDATTLAAHQIIINCSPVGTFPNIDQCPTIPYEEITKDHLLYDLIYNPAETLFLSKGKEKGATIKNGYDMLLLQAEKNWAIWSNNF